MNDRRSTQPAAPTRRPFLGVERSATAAAPGATGSTSAARRARSRSRSGTDLPELLARILAGRGVEVDDVAAFLDPTVRGLMPDPDTLAGMARPPRGSPMRSTRGEKVAIFGDYDVDGATSAALLARFLRHCGLDPHHPHPRPHLRRLWAERRGDPRARRPRRDAARHRRLRHHQPSSRSPRRTSSASTSSSSTITRPTRRCRRRSRWSIRTGTTISPGSAISPRSASCS